MRWERLFADLEAEFAAADASDLVSEIAERVRYERGRLSFADRLRGSIGTPVSVRLLGRLHVSGTVTGVGPDWLLLDHRSGRACLLRLPAVLEAVGLSAQSASGAAGEVERRFDFVAVLRRLADARTAVQATLMDGTTYTGTIERVGADFLEMSDHRVDEPSLASGAAPNRTIPISAAVAVREL